MQKKDESQTVIMLAAKISVPEPKNESGRGVAFVAQREIIDEELLVLNDATSLIRKFTSGSPYVSFGQQIDVLVATAEQASAEWRDDEQAPNINLMQGLHRIVSTVATELASLEAVCRQPPERRHPLAGIADHTFTVDFRRISPVNKHAYVVMQDATEWQIHEAFFEELRQYASDCWVTALVENEQSLEGAVRCVRNIANSVLVGEPILWAVPVSAHITQIEHEVIPVRDGNSAMQMLVEAKTIRDLQNRRPDGAPSSNPLRGDRGQNNKKTAGQEQLSGQPLHGESFANAGEEMHEQAESTREWSDAGLTDLTMLGQSMLSQTIDLQEKWSGLLDTAMEVDPGHNFWVTFQSFGVVMQRVLNEQKRNVLDPAGIDANIQSAPDDFVLASELLADSADLVDRQSLNSLSMLTVFEGITTAVRSLHEPTLEGATMARPLVRRAFWNDGAFKNFVNRFDMLQQILLQQLTSVDELVAERLSLGGRLIQRPEADQASFTMFASIGSIQDYFASMARSSWVIGDYLSTVFACRSLIRSMIDDHCSLENCFRNAELPQQQSDALLRVAKHIESFILNPIYDAARIVYLASLCPAIIDLLRRETGSETILKASP